MFTYHYICSSFYSYNNQDQTPRRTTKIRDSNVNRPFAPGFTLPRDQKNIAVRHNKTLGLLDSDSEGYDIMCEDEDNSTHSKKLGRYIFDEEEEDDDNEDVKEEDDDNNDVEVEVDMEEEEEE